MREKSVYSEFERSKVLLPELPDRCCMRWKHSQGSCGRIRVGGELGGRSLYFEKLPKGLILFFVRWFDWNMLCCKFCWLYLLLQGHQFVNSTDGIHFSHAAQKCAPCAKIQYILNSNDPKFSCQNCPIGAVCDGSTLKGLVEGSVWEGNLEAGVYILKSCPVVSFAWG
jgi:hypothetical protein